MRVGSLVVGAMLLGAACARAHADLVVYDDASRNGFDPNCSFNAAPDFAETAVVHAGTDAIGFAPAQFGAVSWCAPSSLTTTSFSALSLWVNGGASGGQDLQLVIGLAGTPQANASLATLLGHPLAAGTWVQVNASFDAGPLAYAGNFDQISIQDNSGNLAGNPQPTVYLDDVSLAARVTTPDEIFKNGFEAMSATGTILIEPNVTACSGNLLAERYTWQDAGGWTRSATLSHNDTAQNGGHEGELCDYTYHVNAGTVRDVQELTAGGAGGFGYVVAHLHDASLANNQGEDDSPLGHGYTGSFVRLLNGRHHALLRFQVNYPRWGLGPGNVPTKYDMPVTIDWLIASGRNHPLWTASFDLNAAPANAVDSDSRAPYGDMAFDGAGTAAGYGNPVAGVAWGDHYKFTTTGATPMSLNSAWTWNQPNTVPYVYLWTQAPSPDAEMGIVQSEDIGKQDAGSEFSYINWNRTSGPGNGCPLPNDFGFAYAMPCVDYQWAYQANADDTSTGPEGDKHLTWGTGYGFLGGTAYNTDGSLGTGNGWPLQSYGTYVVLGLHSTGATDAQVAQVENAMSSTLSASVGTVKTNGPAGVGRSDTRNFQPAGYNRTYGTWEVNASGGNATLTLNAAGSGLLNPMFIVHNHANALPAAVTLDGAALVADVDYFATVDPPNADHADTRLWLTVNRNWTGSHVLAVQ